MNKKQTRVNLDNSTNLYKTRLESDKCLPEEKEHIRYFFIQTILSSPDLWNCGPGKFDKMIIFYENGRWVVETEYTERFQSENEKENIT